MNRQSEAKPERKQPETSPEIPLVRLGSRAYLALAPDVDERAVRAVRQLATRMRRAELLQKTEEPSDQSGGASSLGSH